MKIYLAARYSRRVELLGYKSLLEAIGHDVTSRWLPGEHQILDGQMPGKAGEAEVESGSSQAATELRERFAREDWQDLVSADAVISFTEAPRSKSSRGGRHVEFGAALALNKICIVVGPRENVFHCLPAVTVVRSIAEAVAWLRGTPVEPEPVGNPS